jgi:hypothetical protein
VYLKNKRHGLKLLIEASAPRPNECAEEHWEGMKHLIASKVKQEKTIKYCAMKAHVSTPIHYKCGGKVDVVGKLVSL